MDFPDTEPTRAAVHEAGHALVGTARGVHPTAMAISGDPDRGQGKTWFPEHPPEAQVWIAHGGYRGEEVVFGAHRPRAAFGDDDDLTLAHRIANENSLPNIAIMDQVRDFLRDHRAGLEFVAARLLEQSVIQGQQLADLLQEALLR